MKDRKEKGKQERPSPTAIVFGFDRATDEQSLLFFLQRFAERELLDVLLPRLQDDEISATFDSLMGILRKHLSEKEYHRLILTE